MMYANSTSNPIKALANKLRDQSVENSDNDKDEVEEDKVEQRNISMMGPQNSRNIKGLNTTSNRLMSEAATKSPKAILESAAKGITSGTFSTLIQDRMQPINNV